MTDSTTYATGNDDDGDSSDEDSFRMMLDSVRDYAIFRLNKSGIVTTWNTGAQRLKGYNASEIIGQHFSVFYPREKVEQGWPQEELRRAIAIGQYAEEGWRVRKDGSSFWANVVISVIRNPAGNVTGFAKVTRDMTERRRLEELEASSRRMNEFLALLGHELRNPLAPIRNAVTVLQRVTSTSPGREILEKTSAVIDRQLTHISRLVDDLLEAGRITTGKVKVHTAPITIQSVVDRAIEALKSKIDGKGQRLHIIVPDDPLLVQGDMTRLVQVFQNLLDNASKYTATGGLIELAVVSEERSVSIFIKDNGRGIDGCALEAIFNLFVQEEDPSSTKDEGGLGIGLTLARSLVELHGGRIQADSPGRGAGSTFTVSLPLLTQNSAIEAPEFPADGLAATVLKVLVVDDNEDSADSMALLLRVSGHVAETAYSGAQALGIAPVLRPDVILLDISMPLMNGYEAVRRLRDVVERNDLVIAAMTGYGLDADKKRTAAAGFDAHLTKPVDARALEAVLAAARAERKLRSSP